MKEKVKAAEAFLKSLENPLVTTNILVDRVDVHILYVINNYAELIAKIKDKTNIEEKDIISCSMIIGYLLKSHIDRYEIEEAFKN